MRVANLFLSWLTVWGINTLGELNNFQNALIFVLLFIGFGIAGIFDTLQQQLKEGVKNNE